MRLRDMAVGRLFLRRKINHLLIVLAVFVCAVVVLARSKHNVIDLSGIRSVGFIHAEAFQLFAKFSEMPVRVREKYVLVDDPPPEGRGCVFKGSFWLLGVYSQKGICCSKIPKLDFIFRSCGIPKSTGRLALESILGWFKNVVPIKVSNHIHGWSRATVISNCDKSPCSVIRLVGIATPDSIYDAEGHERSLNRLKRCAVYFVGFDHRSQLTEIDNRNYDRDKQRGPWNPGVFGFFLRHGFYLVLWLSSGIICGRVALLFFATDRHIWMVVAFLFLAVFAFHLIKEASTICDNTNVYQLSRDRAMLSSPELFHHIRPVIARRDIHPIRRENVL
jgi:hypothetical protein